MSIESFGVCLAIPGCLILLWKSYHSDEGISLGTLGLCALGVGVAPITAFAAVLYCVYLFDESEYGASFKRIIARPLLRKNR